MKDKYLAIFEGVSFSLAGLSFVTFCAFSGMDYAESIKQHKLETAYTQCIENKLTEIRKTNPGADLNDILAKECKRSNRYQY